MISIIICSREPNIPQELRENVESTIGCEHEWIIVDNSRNQYNIFQAYNEGVARSTGDILCFMHDDILFHTKNWGKIIECVFADNGRVGAIGVVGAHLVPDVPAPMWAFQRVSTYKLYSKTNPSYNEIVDSGKNDGDNGYWFGNQQFSQGKPFVQVANIDGLWMCFRHSLFDSIRWDDENYNGFHCYDADISMQINKTGYDIVVTNEVLIEHASPGTLDQKYFNATETWYKKWKNHLPIVRGVSLTQRQLLILSHYTFDALERQKELMEYRRLRNTHAYKMGSALLRPWRWLRKQLH